MDSTRETLREHLIAMVEAAPELPREARADLADVFLDELEANYQVTPRSLAHRVDPVTLPPQRRLPFVAPWPVLAALPFLLIPLLVFAHIPFLVPILFLFVFGRMGRGWGRRGYR